MKKKLIMIIPAIMILLTGCMKELIEEDIRNNIIDTLSDEEIINSEWEFVDWQKECDEFLPTGDAIGYNYIYKDENDIYYTVHMDKILNSNDNYYGDNNIFMKGGEEYYLIEISECDVTTTTYEYSDGKIAEELNIDTLNYESSGTYLLHHNESLFNIKSNKLIIEEVIWEEDNSVNENETDTSQ